MNAPLPQDALAAGPAAGSVRPDTAQTLSARRERQQRLVSALSGVLPTALHRAGSPRWWPRCLPCTAWAWATWSW